MAANGDQSRPGNLAELASRISDDDVRSLWHRIGVRLRRAFNQGVGYFIVFLLCLVGAAHSARLLYFTDQRHDSIILDRVARLLGTTHEVNSTDERPGLVGSVLANVNSEIPENDTGAKGRWGCPHNYLDCRAMDAFLQNMQILTHALIDIDGPKSSLETGCSPIPSHHNRLDSALEQLVFPAGLPNAERSELRARARDVILDIRCAHEEKRTRALLRACEPEIGTDKETIRMKSLSPVLCESAEGQWDSSTYLSIRVPRRATRRSPQEQHGPTRTGVLAATHDSSTGAPAGNAASDFERVDLRPNERSDNDWQSMFPDDVVRSVEYSAIMESALQISRRHLEWARSVEFGQTTIPIRTGCSASNIPPAASSTVEPARSCARDRADDQPRWVQAYYISPTEVLRIWTPNRPDPEERFEGTESWSRSGYFKRLMVDASKKTYTTKAYIDRGGHGLIRTKCMSLDPPHDRLHETFAWLGIVCVDFAIPEMTFIHEVAQSPFFSVLRATIQTRNGLQDVDPSIRFVRRSSRRQTDASGEMTWQSAIEVEPDTILGRTIHAKREGDEETRSTLKKSIASALRDANDMHTVETKIVKVPMGADSGYWVPLSLRNDGTLSGLVLVPEVPGKLEYRWAGVLLFVFGTIVIICGTFGITRTYRTIAEHGRIDMLRNLQVGVVAVAEDDRIEIANDRAEEILNLTLPKSQNRPTWRFGALIHRNILQEQHLRESVARGSDFCDYDEIGRTRGLGLHSAYYARIRMLPATWPVARRWIRVSASPVLARAPRLYGRRGSAPVIFGIVECVETSIAASLEAAWRESNEAS